MNYLTVLQLEKSLKAMTILDMIFIPEEESYLRIINSCLLEEGYKFIANNGSGDNLTIYITKNGAFIKGFDHENELSQFAAEEWDDTFFEKIYENAPYEFMTILRDNDEPDEVTFCMWCSIETSEWTENITEGNDGGKDYLLGYIHTTAEEWCEWAKYYYEKKLDINMVKAVYNQESITVNLINTLNPDIDAEKVLQEIKNLRWL